MSQPMPYRLIENLVKTQGDRIIRRTWNTSHKPSQVDAMNPENYGLSLDDVSPLGYGVFDYGTLRQSAFMVEAYFVITA
jgi:hypothetical protein